MSDGSYGRAGGPDPRDRRGGTAGQGPYGRGGGSAAASEASAAGARPRFGGGNGTRVITGADPRARRAAAPAAVVDRGAGGRDVGGAGYGAPPAGGGYGQPGGGGYGGGGPPPPPVGAQRFGAPPPAQYGAPPPGQYGGPPPGQYGGPPPGQYGAPPPGQYGAPPPGQYGAPPPQYGGAPAYGGLPAPPVRMVPPPAVDPNSVTEYIMCPPERAGKVIGHGGEKINGIQVESGATVKIQNQSDVGPGQPRRITISGAPDRVARASQMLWALIDDRPAARPASGHVTHPSAPPAEIFINVESTDFGKIIGRGGDTIRRLQDESGVRIQVDRPNSGVLITGDPSGCEVARTLLREVLDAQDDSRGPAASSSITTEIDAQGQEGRIIGKGGENIRNLAAQSGAKIQIIKETGMVRFTGSQSQVDEAIRLVNEFIDSQVAPRGAGAPAGIPGVDSGYSGAQAYLDDKPGLVKYKPLWETHQSPEGYTYYYNTTTGETQWEEPEDYDGFS